MPHAIAAVTVAQKRLVVLGQLTTGVGSDALTFGIQMEIATPVWLTDGDAASASGVSQTVVAQSISGE